MTDHEIRAIERHGMLLHRLGVEKPQICVIGANEGNAVFAYLDALPEADIWCFEPIKLLADKLRKSLTDRLYVSDFAVGAHDGTVLLNIRKDSRVSSILDVEPELLARSQHYETIETRSIEIHSLNELTRVANVLPVPDLLCTDTQGFDLEVLKGASALLSSGETLIVACEIYFASAYVGQPQAYEIMGYLAEFGYRLYGFDRLVEASSGTLYFGTALFLSPQAWDKLGLL